MTTEDDVAKDGAPADDPVVSDDGVADAEPAAESEPQKGDEPDVAPQDEQTKPSSREPTPQAADESVRGSTAPESKVPAPAGSSHTSDTTAAATAVQLAFSQLSFVGIRSLPDKLEADFRELKLMESVTMTKEGRRQQREAEKASGSAKPPELSVRPPSHAAAPAPSPSSRLFPKGQRRTKKYSSMPEQFTWYDYMSDPLEQKLEIRRLAVANGKKKWMAPKDFKTCALPRVHKAAGMFDRFTYSMSPFEVTEEDAKMESRRSKQKMLHGPLRAGGCVNEAEQAKIRRKELIKWLTQQLKRDWPHTEIEIFTDDYGW